MIRQLFDVYTHAAEKREHWKLFPAFYRERLEEAHSDSERIRTCIDLISGFTENQVHRIHNRLTGSASESSLNDPLR
jgi:dGTP triphosphohydrolase